MLAAARLQDVPAALQIHCELVDGADSDAAQIVFQNAADRVRTTGRPVFVEATLERWPGSHQVKADFPTGVTDISLALNLDKVEGKHADWIKRSDPLLRATRALIEDGVSDLDGLLELDAKVNKLMEESRSFAEASPFPDVSVAFTGVFAS